MTTPPTTKCPTCHAHPNQPCTTTSGAKAKHPHTARKRATRAPTRLTPEQLHDTHRFIPLDELQLLPGNPNQGHTESLEASLDELGWIDGIVVHQGVVIAGNHRVEQARAADEKGLPGYDLSAYPVDDARRMAMALAHNRTTRLGVDDPQLLAQALQGLPGELSAVAGIDHIDDATRAILEGNQHISQPAPLADCPIYKAPFQWFGGKSRVAPWIWAALGDVDNYVEPFAGSLALLMRRPLDHDPRFETVNDYDGFVSNWWRAAKHAPTDVADHTNWPVTENDLHARRAWLAEHHPDLAAKLEGDPDWYDAKIAGWWAWAQSASIGSFGLGGPWKRTQRPDGTWTLTKARGNRGVSRSIPNVGSQQGVNRSRPHLSSNKGVIGTDVIAGEGINAGLAERNALMATMAERLRHVRVTSGDWARVCTTGALTAGSTKGVFLDPPYSNEGRSEVYIHDDGAVAALCRDWAIEHGDDPTIRIVLAGYVEEHDDIVPASWTRLRWSTGGGMAKPGTRGKINAVKECLWLSPHCYTPPAIPDVLEDVQDPGGE